MNPQEENDTKDMTAGEILQDAVDNLDNVEATFYTKNEDKTKNEDDELDDLPFAKAEIVRLMKANLDSDKIIRERVKIEMNKFLGRVLEEVCKQLNDYPYTAVDYEMLKESIYPYENITRINQEKERILLHLDAIKSDCDALQSDIIHTMKLKDTVDEDNSNYFKGE